ncbi:hypothetical protein Droror1_Dr00021106, partial [Drosera rotundifolia]
VVSGINRGLNSGQNFYLIPDLVGPCSLKITYSAHTDLSVKFQSHRSSHNGGSTLYPWTTASSYDWWSCCCTLQWNAVCTNP